MCAAFAALALGRTGPTARACGVSDDTMRTMGVRDLASAITLLTARDVRGPLLARLLIDSGDTALIVRRKPTIAAMAAAFAVWSAVTLVAACRRSHTE